MKKILLVLLVATTMTMISCGGKTETTTETITETTTETVVETPIETSVQ